MCSYDGRKDDLSGVVVGKRAFHTVAAGKVTPLMKKKGVRTVLNNLYFLVIFHIEKHLLSINHFNWEV